MARAPGVPIGSRRVGQVSGPPALRRRALTEADRDAWLDYVRHIVALPGHAAPTLAPIPSMPQRHTQPEPQLKTPSKPAPLLPLVATGERPSGLDDSSWTKLRTGKLQPDRTLDLHGQTAQRAFHALAAFLHQAYAERLRCVEIITGRGDGETGGVLRRELPIWLNLAHLRPYILALSHPHKANPGSVRILLRRRRA